MEQFTANEVLRKLRERFTSGNSVPVPDVRLTRAEFDAFADLLEAQAKAVPVGEVVGVAGSYGEMRMIRWRDRYSPAVGTKLYTHSVPSDADRLAEALRNLVSGWVAIADDGDATLEDSTIGYRACANRLSAMLAAHSAQAQPPAASVTERDEDPEEHCESGDASCGPVEFHDSEGVPLCKACWDALVAENRADRENSND